jgi:hypothetical protein
MADNYVLWDRDTANALGAYPTRDAAMARVGRLIRAKGLSFLSDLVLVRQDGNGVPTAFYPAADLLDAVALRTAAVPTSDVHVYSARIEGAWSYQVKEKLASYGTLALGVVFAETSGWLITNQVILDLTSPSWESTARIEEIRTFEWPQGLADAEGQAKAEAANKQSTLALAA